MISDIEYPIGIRQPILGLFLGEAISLVLGILQLPVDLCLELRFHEISPSQVSLSSGVAFAQFLFRQLCQCCHTSCVQLLKTQRTSDHVVSFLTDISTSHNSCSCDSGITPKREQKVCERRFRGSGSLQRKSVFQKCQSHFWF